MELSKLSVLYLLLAHSQLHVIKKGVWNPLVATNCFRFFILPCNNSAHAKSHFFQCTVFPKLPFTILKNASVSNISLLLFCFQLMVALTGQWISRHTWLWQVNQSEWNVPFSTAISELIIAWPKAQVLGLCGTKTKEI